ncbi:MAG: hypothetical protein AAF664_26035 [Planctomycetota bacterium]
MLHSLEESSQSGMIDTSRLAGLAMDVRWNSRPKNGQESHAIERCLEDIHLASSMPSWWDESDETCQRERDRLWKLAIDDHQSVWGAEDPFCRW